MGLAVVSRSVAHFGSLTSNKTRIRMTPAQQVSQPVVASSVLRLYRWHPFPSSVALFEASGLFTRSLRGPAILQVYLYGCSALDRA